MGMDKSYHSLGRALIYGVGTTTWLISAVFLFDLFIVEHIGAVIFVLLVQFMV